jgi:hypothetical protein
MFILVVASTKLQKFYSLRVVKNLEQIEKRNLLVDLQYDYEINYIIKDFYFENSHCILYRYYSKFRATESSMPIKNINNYYKNSIYLGVNEKLIDDILDNFLKSYPPQFHLRSRELNEYYLFKKNLSLYDKLKICDEHADYAKNNIITVKKGLFKKKVYLIDFEFTRHCQPIGYDLYVYLKSCRRENEITGFPDCYPELQINKIKLVNAINDIIDGKV